MGIFDKIKNLFYDEEEVDVPVENQKEEITIKSGNVAVKEKDEEKRIVDTRIDENEQDKIEDVMSERDLMSTRQNFKFPIIFEDEDIANIEKKEPPKKEKEPAHENPNNKYKKPVLDRKVIDEVVKKPKKFKPTPIISPIYGILDKNYEKNNLENNKKNSSIKSDKDLEINFDTIRQKAYGSLTDDLEKELSKSEDKIDEIENKIDNILEENNLLTDLEEDNENDEIKNNNLYSYEDFGVEYKIDDSNDDINSNKKKNKTDKEVELTEDLFNLIDSMYDK